MEQERHWDLTKLYTGYDDPAIEEDFKKLEKTLEELDKQSQHLESPQEMENFLKINENMYKLVDPLFSFASLNMSTNSSDKKAAAIMSRAENMMVQLPVFTSRSLLALKHVENIDAYINHSPYTKELEFVIRKSKKTADHMLSEAEEKIIAIMKLNASNEWSKLFSTLNSKLMVDMKDGRKLPFAVVRSMASDSDAKVRKEAYECELESYKKVEDSIAAALNCIKGEVIHESALRGYESPLLMTLEQTNISKETLDAMISAMEEQMPMMRRYYKAKAKYLGHTNGLPFYDLFAPVGKDAKKYTYDEACNIVVDAYSTFSEKSATIVKRAIDQDWIDPFPKEGKVSGAFCAPLLNCGEFRVMSNFNGNLGDVFTLAHELGHGYHAIVAKDENALNLDYPMTLAETASTFGETILGNKLYNETGSITVIDSILEGAAQVIIDIYSRFIFEQSVFEERKKRPLFAEDFKELMIEAQKKSYGDALDPNYLHPYMWACKGHYYSAGNNYYNFPYAFGQLFATGLYMKFKEDPETFKPAYDKLLASAGKCSVEEACNIVGVDPTQKDFWLKSFKIFESYVEDFERLCK